MCHAGLVAGALAIVEDEPATWTIDVQDVSIARAPQDPDNPGLVRIVVRLQTAAGAMGRLLITGQAGAHR